MIVETNIGGEVQRIMYQHLKTIQSDSDCAERV